MTNSALEAHLNYLLGNPDGPAPALNAPGTSGNAISAQALLQLTEGRAGVPNYWHEDFPVDTLRFVPEHTTVHAWMDFSSIALEGGRLPIHLDPAQAVHCTRRQYAWSALLELRRPDQLGTPSRAALVIGEVLDEQDRHTATSFRYGALRSCAEQLLNAGAAPENVQFFIPPPHHKDVYRPLFMEDSTELEPSDTLLVDEEDRELIGADFDVFPPLRFITVQQRFGMHAKLRMARYVARNMIYARWREQAELGCGYTLPQGKPARNAS